MEKMKNKKIFFSLTIIMVILSCVILFFTKESILVIERNILFHVYHLFDKVLEEDYQRRMIGHKYSFINSVDNDWPQNGISVTTADGTRILSANIDSIQKLPLENKLRLLNESYLLYKHPINPDTLNLAFQNILRGHGYQFKTGICYTEAVKKKTVYSGTDTAFFISTYPLKEFKTGIFNEIAVQAYVKVPFTVILEKGGFRFYIPVIFWVFLLSSYVIYVFKATKRKRTMQNTKEELIDLLILDKKKSCLHYKNQLIKLTPSQTQLVGLFLEKPDYFLTKEEIINELWQGLDNPNNRLSQTIKRLREVLSSVKEIEIENVRGIGFRITMH